MKCKIKSVKNYNKRVIIIKKRKIYKVKHVKLHIFCYVFNKLFKCYLSVDNLVSEEKRLM